MQAILVDHIGIIVRNIQKSLIFYQKALGLQLEDIEKNEAYHVDIAYLRCGDTLIELLQPTGEGSFKDILDKKGEGLHHIAFRTNNINEALGELKKMGIPLADKTPKTGGGGAMIAFVEADAANNVSIELIER